MALREPDAAAVLEHIVAHVLELIPEQDIENPPRDRQNIGAGPKVGGLSNY